MAHDHEHSGESYYLDQLCSIGICGAIGVVMFLLWYWEQLNNLHSKLRIFVMLGGTALLAMALIRAVALWIAVGKQKRAAAHHHDHHGHHDHSHGHGHHHHHHDHDHAEHSHDHAHQDHKHGHDTENHHDHGHDHGWAPWRYVVLFVPVLLFVLVPPRSAADEEAVTDLDFTSRGEVQVTAPGMVAAVGDEFIISGSRFDTDFSVDGTYHVAKVSENVFTTLETVSVPDGTTYKGGARAKSAIPYLPYKKVEQAANDPQARIDFKGKRTHLRGWFKAQDSSNKRQFNLVRYKINCCAIDAVPVRLIIRSQTDVDIAEHEGKWVDIVGTLDFEQSGNGFITILNLERIEKREVDAQQFIE